MAGSRNRSFDDRDTNSLQYQGFWFHEGTWNASNIGQTGTLSSSNDFNASVKFVFPEPAIAFAYYGIPRSKGGTYGICVDCDPNAQNFQTIDAVNATDDGKNPPVALYSTQFPTPGVHEIILRNQPDPRFPNNNSQITIDRFEIQVVDPNAPPPSSTPTPTPTSIPTTIPTQTTPTSSTATQTSPLGSSGTPVGAIVGGILGGLALLLVILASWFWCWRRKERNTEESERPEFDPSPTTQPQSSLGRMSEAQTQTNNTRPVVHTRRKSVGMQRHNDHWPRPSLGSSSDWTLTAASSGRVIQRETDAGPVNNSEGDETEVLPPDYEQVVGSSGRTRSSSRPHTMGEGSNRGARTTIPEHE